MAELYMMTEHSPFMMGFVWITDAGRALVIDGGRPEDMPHLYELVGDREIAAWILTHPHIDHVSGFLDNITKDEKRARIRAVYSAFPSPEFALSCEPEEQPCYALEFERLYPVFAEKAVRIVPGMKLTVDELSIEFLFCGGEKYRQPKPNLAVNESSSVFRVTADGMKSVLFLGDLGPEGGRDLLRQCAEKLPSAIVQMAHHGHSGVTEEVYRKIAPEACMWCAPLWLYDEADVEFEPELWGTRHTRAWMERLGVGKHYVSGEGTQKIAVK